ncbi:hypothetical protein ALC60_11248 [Trachymyrmex zeteki]|uniref:Transposable element P transposase-like RNase H domain-containing protein n=1 Tax=Mycetomoellerius zeteki TaxID=64791 RepID=A0A151WPF0_9HYME|nr:hypothetical protein ALC60_11248 [Trachymyrmex zeteki]
MQIIRLKKKVECIRKKCAQANTQAVEDVISKLPINQQLSVQACLTTSKAKNSKGIRYTTQWVYECLLLRIKSKKTYNHLRNHNILTLPTPKHQARKKGDHALVFMFQPFKGKWVQTLGYFLNYGSVSGVVLHQLVMECIILVEKSNLKVDGVTSDGASWSDFSHLMKCLRNFFTKHNQYDGIWVSSKSLSL